MARLKTLIRSASVKGILPDGLVMVVDVQSFRTAAIGLTYKDAVGQLGSEQLYCESMLETAAERQRWLFDGAMLCIVSEAYRIASAYLFDLMLAIHSWLIQPLLHQITAVYDEIFSCQPLRFLLTDDLGVDKTIMVASSSLIRSFATMTSTAWSFTSSAVIPTCRLSWSKLTGT
jgi:hypothetical protein